MSVRNKIVIVSFSTLLAICSLFALFVFEYKGYAEIFAAKYPYLSFVSELPRILDIFYLPYQLSGTSLPVYDIIADSEDLLKLERALMQNSGDLLDGKNKEKIRVEFIANGKSYEAKMEVHGDLSNHWQDRKKSWRIAFDENDLFENKKEINLILPEDRSFISEQMSNYRAKKMGLIVPESQFVVLKINGRQPAVYFEVESWSREFLAKAGLPDESSLYGENDDLAFQGYNHDLLESAAYWKKYTQRESAFDDFSDIDLLGRLVHEASDEEFFKKISLLIDMDSFYKWQAHSMLMGSTHQDFIHNVRLYFNSSKGKFEFFPWDLRQFDRGSFVDLDYNSLVSRLLENPDSVHERNMVLWEYVKDGKNLEDDLAFYDITFNEVKSAFYKDRVKAFTNLFFRRKIQNMRDLLIQQYGNVKSALGGGQVLVEAHVGRDEVRFDISVSGFSDTLFVPNFPCYFDVQFSKEVGESVRISSSREVPQGYAFEEEIKVVSRTYTFFAKRNDVDLDNLKLKFRNAITNEKIKETVRLIDQTAFEYFEKASYTREEFLEENHIFKAKDDGIVLVSGEYVISEPIIVPRGVELEIQRGARMIFERNASLVSYDSVKAEGAVFTAADKKNGWGVFAVLNAPGFFRDCVFEYGGQAYINGVFYSGQLSVFHGDANIEDCTFRFAFGDDGLNVKRGNVLLKGNKIYENGFDGLDLDWASGKVLDNVFSKNGNDNLDLGGVFDVVVWGNAISNSSDKGISIGEQSMNVVVANNVIKDSVIGVAIKDDSDIDFVNNAIVDNKVNIAIYQKKPVFGGAHANFTNCVIWGGGKEVFLDDLSTISVNYSSIEGGYDGEGNISVEPIDNRVSGGNIEATKKIYPGYSGEPVVGIIYE